MSGSSKKRSRQCVTGYQAAYPALVNLFKTSRNGDLREYSLGSIALLREPAAVSLFESVLDDSDDTYRELSAKDSRVWTMTRLLSRFGSRPSGVRTCA